MKATCLSFGEAFSADVVKPLFLASAALPDLGDSATMAAHVEEVRGCPSNLSDMANILIASAQ